MDASRLVIDRKDLIGTAQFRDRPPAALRWASRGSPKKLDHRAAGWMPSRTPLTGVEDPPVRDDEALFEAGDLRLLYYPRPEEGRRNRRCGHAPRTGPCVRSAQSKFFAVGSTDLEGNADRFRHDEMRGRRAITFRLQQRNPGYGEGGDLCSCGHRRDGKRRAGGRPPRAGSPIAT